MEYGNLNHYEAMGLPCDLYALMRKHATIDQLQKTEEGRKYLADCERMQVTTPDFETIRSLKGYKAEEA